MKEQTQETVMNIRQIVHALRPPSLDDLGLAAAIRAHISQLSVSRERSIFLLEASLRDFPGLSAAVEVDTCRIVLEALTNVIPTRRHMNVWSISLFPRRQPGHYI